MPKFRSRKGGQAYPITPRIPYAKYERGGDYTQTDSDLARNQIALAKTAFWQKMYTGDRASAIRIKRGLVNASNKTKHKNPALSKAYEDAYKAMTIPAKDGLVYRIDANGKRCNPDYGAMYNSQLNEQREYALKRGWTGEVAKIDKELEKRDIDRANHDGHRSISAIDKDLDANMAKWKRHEQESHKAHDTEESSVYYDRETKMIQAERERLMRERGRAQNYIAEKERSSHIEYVVKAENERGDRMTIGTFATEQAAIDRCNEADKSGKYKHINIEPADRNNKTVWQKMAEDPEMTRWATSWHERDNQPSNMTARIERPIRHKSREHALEVAKDIRESTGNQTRVVKGKDGKYSVFEYKKLGQPNPAPTNAPHTLYVYNKDSKGNLKAYGQTHPSKEAAEKHLANLKEYYGDRFDREVVSTKIEASDGKQRSSKQIIKDKFSKPNPAPASRPSSHSVPEDDNTWRCGDDFERPTRVGKGFSDSHARGDYSHREQIAMENTYARQLYSKSFNELEASQKQRIRNEIAKKYY